MDLTGEVPPGRDRVMSVADPTNVILEADEANPPELSGELRLRGWLALPQAPPAGPAASMSAAGLPRRASARRLRAGA